MSEPEDEKFTNEFADQLPDESLDVVFESLKQEIQQKKTHTDKKYTYICKICGTQVSTNIKVIRCSHCSIPICTKCRSCGFCLNCFVNLNNDSRKTLKLYRVLIWTVPLFLTFLLIYGWRYFLIVEFSVILLFSTLYCFARHYITRNATKYITPEWTSTINSPYYRKLCEIENKNRYIPEEYLKITLQAKQKRIDRLTKWINLESDYSKIPVPVHIAEIPDDLDEKDIIADKVDETNMDYSEISDVRYDLTGLPCPKCNEIIQFANFCASCNIKFCPKCHTEHNPHAKMCLCGTKFVPLEIEYYRWLKKSHD